MVPTTTVFGCTIMLFSEGLQTCTRADLVFTHQLVTVLATVKDYQTSFRGMFLMVSAVAIFGSIRLTYLFEVVPY